MELNADFSRRAIIHAASLDWKPSPIAGVERSMLDRIGGEVARATSIVRYAPRSRFSVSHARLAARNPRTRRCVPGRARRLSGAGSKIRNPPRPPRTHRRSETGCTIFVKLWQFDLDDRTHAKVYGTGLTYGSAPERAGS